MGNEALQSTRMLVSATAIRREVKIGLAGRGLLCSGTKTGSIGRSVTRWRNARGMARWQQKDSIRLISEFLGDDDNESVWPLSDDLGQQVGYERWMGGCSGPC